MNISDAHVHLGQSNGIFASIKDAGTLLAWKAKYQIDKILVMSFENDIMLTNAVILKLAKDNPQIHALYWIQKIQIESDVAILKRLLGKTITGVKFHGAYERMPITAPIYTNMLEVLNENEGLLLVHCGRYLEARPESNTSYSHVLTVAQKYPKIKIILAHMGGSDTTIIKRAVNEAKALSNVYFDTSGITTPYAIEYAVYALDGADRILFGSDTPWCSFNSMYYNVIDANICDRDRQLIFHDNFDAVIR